MPEIHRNFLPYDMSEDLQNQLPQKVKAWYIVNNVCWDETTLVIDVTTMHGSGYESLTAFLEGLCLGLPKRRTKPGPRRNDSKPI